MITLARTFAKRGYGIDLLILQTELQGTLSVPPNIRLIELGARIAHLGSLSLALTATLRLVKWLRKEQPTAILCTITGANLAVLLALKISGARARVVIREASTLHNLSSTMRLWAMKWMYPRADAVVAVSSAVATELKEVIGVDITKIFHIPNPIDEIFILERSKEKAEHRWVMDPNGRLIVSVGRLTCAKDHQTLVRAFALLPESLNARLLIIGEGPERSRLESLISALGISDRVELFGFDENPWRWVARAKVFVLSSKWEGHPNALIEAVTLRCPVVVTNYDHTAAEFAARFALSLVPPGNVAVLAQAIEEQLIRPVKPCASETLPTVDCVANEYLGALQLPFYLDTRGGPGSPRAVKPDA